jgi:alpha-L-rhamnosidase
MGKNMVGWVRLKVRGEAGTKVTLRHAEALNPDGTIYTTNLRFARATDSYVLRGDGEEVYEPRFTFHGFRYVEVTGYPGEPPLDTITGCVVHSDTPPTGYFECSNQMVNKLHENILWGQRGNFLSVPTDCPQRDERLGWTGDAQVFVRTASYNMDVTAFFAKWMVDVADAQSSEGAFPDVAPLLPMSLDLSRGAPAWGDAGIIVPWTMYRVYGDTRIIEHHYQAMTLWMGYLHGANPDLLRRNKLGNNYGD